MDWRIRVRVTRVWPSVGNNHNFVGFNMILLDAENYHVHAFANAAVWNSLGHMIMEGNAYDFERFVTREPVGRLRPVTSDRAIVLTTATTVHLVPLEAITIPRHKFELVNLSEIYNHAVSFLTEQTPLYANDVLGEVRNLEPVRHINTHSGTRSCARFQLYDGRMSVKVIVWGDLIERLAPLYHGNIDTPTIVLLSSVFGREFKNSVQVSTTANSGVFINLHYEPNWGDLIERLAPLYHGNIDTPTIVLLSSVFGREFKNSVQVSTTANSGVFINLHYEPVLQMRQRILAQQNEDLEVDP